LPKHQTMAITNDPSQIGPAPEGVMAMERAARLASKQTNAELRQRNVTRSKQMGYQTWARCPLQDGVRHSPGKWIPTGGCETQDARLDRCPLPGLIGARFTASGSSTEGSNSAASRKPPPPLHIGGASGKSGKKKAKEAALDLVAMYKAELEAS
jgi:hypothetical protein